MGNKGSETQDSKKSLYKNHPKIKGQLVLKGESKAIWRCRQTPCSSFPRINQVQRWRQRSPKVSLLPNTCISRKSNLKQVPICWWPVQVATSMRRDVLPSHRGTTQAPNNNLTSTGHIKEQPKFPGRRRVHTLHCVGLHTVYARARKNPSSLS